MDLENLILKVKSTPGFSDNVGMVLIHNGVVRGKSKNGKKVLGLKVSYDHSKIKQIIEHHEKKDGIFKILIKVREGYFHPGEDLMYIVVAGDVRENVKSVLSDVLEEVKSNAVTKQEITGDKS